MSTADEQRSDLTRAAYTASFAVDLFVIDHSDELRRVTPATATRLVIEATLGYLIGEGLITVKPAEEWPQWLGMVIPAHLAPDVAGGVEELRRIEEAVRGEQRRS